MPDNQLTEFLGGGSSLLERRNALAARLNSDWTAAVVYDPQYRGPGYVQEVLEKAGVTCEVEDHCELDDHE